MPNEELEKLRKTPPDQWTMLNVAVMLTEIYGDVKHMKETMGGKANKWVEGVLGLLMTGVGVWTLNQILALIPTVKALF